MIFAIFFAHRVVLWSVGRHRVVSSGQFGLFIGLYQGYTLHTLISFIPQHYTYIQLYAGKKNPVT